MKIYGLVLGLVELIDAKDIGVAQLVVRLSDISSKCIFCVFRLFLSLCRTTFERLLGSFEKNTPGQGGLAVYRSTIPRSILVVTAK